MPKKVPSLCLGVSVAYKISHRDTETQRKGISINHHAEIDRQLPLIEVKSKS